LNEKLYTGHSDNYTGFEPIAWISLKSKSTESERLKAIHMQTWHRRRVGPIKISGEDSEGNEVVHILGRREGPQDFNDGFLTLNSAVHETINYLRATIVPSGLHHAYAQYEDVRIHHDIMIALVVRDTRFPFTRGYIKESRKLTRA
jgi:hypothetical protein